MIDDLVLYVIVGVCLYYLKADNKTILTVSILAFLISEFTKTKVIRMHMVNDKYGLNESIIIEAKLNDEETLFMLDTGYAGPPVISTSYLAIHHMCRYGNVEKRYRKSLELLGKKVTDDERFKVINKLVMYRGCQAYTSGCTMTLAGIGSTMQQQADMLMCKPIKFKNELMRYITPGTGNKPNADVVVTNSLHGSVNILTCDYLIHSSPALIKMKHRTIELHISRIYVNMMSLSFKYLDIEMVGGAFVIPIRIGDEVLKCTMDTGAPGPISIGKQSIHKIKKCQRPVEKKVQQVGVNGEQICSDILYSSGSVAGIEFDEFGIFVNNMNVDGVDGYVGLSVLRALDILILPDKIGFRLSGLKPNLNFSGAGAGNCGVQYSCQ